MNITIHRGTHEIGGSCVEIENRDSRIVIDIGMPLLKDDGSRFDFKKYNHLTGPELVLKKILPDIKGCYDWDTDHKPIDGLLISHAHIDHFGFLNYLSKNIACYLGEGTRHLIGISNQFLNLNMKINKPVCFKNGIPFQVGSFKITPYLMDHSVFDAYAFLVESEGKRILYSGDFREHGGNPEIFEQFLHNAPKGVDALLLEGTLIGSSSRAQKTEKDIEHEIEDILRNTDGIAFMVLSAQNIDRFMSFFNAALKTDRLIVVDVYMANVLDSI
jgi:ribonuclease J